MSAQDGLIDTIRKRMRVFDSSSRDDATRLDKMRVAWENGRDAHEHRRRTGTPVNVIAQQCQVVHTTMNRFVRFYRMYSGGYPDAIDGHPLMWGHYMAVLYLPEAEARDWYLRQAALNGWSTNEMRLRVSSHFYESVRADEPLDPSRPARPARPALRVVEQSFYTYTARILKVVDADTFRVEVDAGFSMRYETKLRLRGIDAYERGTQRGDAAKKFVEEELFGSSPELSEPPLPSPTIVIRTYKGDKYGRFIADLWYLRGETDPEVILKKGHFLNQILLDRAYAVRV